MSDVQLFSFRGDHATELEGSHALLEKHLQSRVEKNMETLFGVRLLASEYRTGDRHGGRIDSLGIDDNDSPVIFEYKRTRSESVIIQGLYYLDWLMDHRAEYTQLVARSPHRESAGSINWDIPRLICVAIDFSRYDVHAVKQIHRSIDLVAYRQFGGELLSLDFVHAANSLAFRRPSSATPAQSNPAPTPVPAVLVDDMEEDGQEGTFDFPATAVPPGLQEKLEKASPWLRQLFYDVVDYCRSLGDDVVEVPRDHSLVYRKLKNFAEVKIHHQIEDVTVNLKLQPAAVVVDGAFTLNKGSNGRNKLPLQVRITRESQAETAYALIERAYRNV